MDNLKQKSDADLWSLRKYLEDCEESVLNNAESIARARGISEQEVNEFMQKRISISGKILSINVELDERINKLFS